MKLRHALACSLVALTAITVAVPSHAQDKKSGAGMPDMAAVMKEYMKLSAPGDGHKALQPLVGSWDCVTRTWFAGPGSPPTEDKGSATFKWIMDGRFVQEDVTGTTSMPDAGGAMKKIPFQGMGITGYDNYRNLYTATWVDNMGTMTLTGTGTMEPGGKAMSIYAPMDEPSLKVVGRMVRMVTRWTDADHFTWEMYDLAAAPDFKVMEITYTRKKA